MPFGSDKPYKPRLGFATGKLHAYLGHFTGEKVLRAGHNNSDEKKPKESPVKIEAKGGTGEASGFLSVAVPISKSLDVEPYIEGGFVREGGRIHGGGGGGIRVRKRF